MKLAIGAVAWLVVLGGCGDGTGPGARLHGVVRLEDVWGRPAAATYAGVTISTAGGASTVSNADGTWELTGLPSGPHDLAFSMPGFATLRVPGAGATLAESEVDTAYLAEPVMHEAIVDSMFITTMFGGDSALVIDGHISVAPPADGLARPVVIFEFGSAEVSGAPGKYWYHYVNLGVLLVDGQTGEAPPPSQTFRMVEFFAGLRHRNPGGTVYFSPHATSAACSCYQDPEFGRVFTNIGPSSGVLTFTLP